MNKLASTGIRSVSPSYTKEKTPGLWGSPGVVDPTNRYSIGALLPFKDRE